MKKKTRDLKKHYRRVERVFRDFKFELSEDSWYNLWHIHLDWDGITNVSDKHRRTHIQYYLKIMEKIEILTKEILIDFQTWIYLDKNEGYCDAIYFNTNNPHRDFPFRIDNIELITEIPKILDGLLDLSEYNIRKVKNKDEKVYAYTIQKKGLGLGLT